MASKEKARWEKMVRRMTMERWANKERMARKMAKRTARKIMMEN
jgi:hypothetical protein